MREPEPLGSDFFYFFFLFLLLCHYFNKSPKNEARIILTTKNNTKEIIRIIGMYFTPFFSFPEFITPIVREEKIEEKKSIIMENMKMNSGEIRSAFPPVKPLIPAP